MKTKFQLKKYSLNNNEINFNMRLTINTDFKNYNEFANIIFKKIGPQMW